MIYYVELSRNYSFLTCGWLYPIRQGYIRDDTGDHLMVIEASDDSSYHIELE